MIGLSFMPILFSAGCYVLGVCTMYGFLYYRSWRQKHPAVSTLEAESSITSIKKDTTVKTKTRTMTRTRTETKGMESTVDDLSVFQRATSSTGEGFECLIQ